MPLTFFRYVLFLVILFFVGGPAVYCYITDKEYSTLPILFHQDNYDDCMLLKDQALYCSFKYTLQHIPSWNDTSLWDTIKEVSIDSRNYRHDVLRHSICVPKACPQSCDCNKSGILDELVECYNEKYKYLGLQGTISELECETDKPKYPIDSIDIIVGLVFLVYLCTLLLATLIDETQKAGVTAGNSFFLKVVNAFSISKNWNRLKTIQNTPDIRRLRCIQGVRVYNMLIVITVHTMMVDYSMPIANPKVFENATNRFPTIFLASGPLAVSTFFLISSWLLSHGLLPLNEFNFTTLLRTFVGRYIRLTPTLTLVVLFQATWMRHMANGPNWNNYIGGEYIRCRKNWWTNLLYVNNYVDVDNICLMTTWYLALDTQYFPILLILIWVMKKCPTKTWWLIGSLVFLHIVYTFYENYLYDFPAFMMPIPESVYDLKHTLNNKQWHVQYISFAGNFGGSILGLVFGYLYHNHKDEQLFSRRIHRITWWVVCVSFTCGLIVISGKLSLSQVVDHDRIWTSLYTAFSRITFATGIGLFMFGTMYGASSAVKRILEWSPLYILGRLTYSAYLFHMPVIFIKNCTTMSPLRVNDYNILCDVMSNITVTYLVATLVTLLFEIPIDQLQKLVMHKQVESHVKQKKNKLK